MSFIKFQPDYFLKKIASKNYVEKKLGGIFITNYTVERTYMNDVTFWITFGTLLLRPSPIVTMTSFMNDPFS